jgi:biotin synthase-like enzyme
MIKTIEDVTALYQKPLLDLVFEAATVHRANHKPGSAALHVTFD